MYSLDENIKRNQIKLITNTNQNLNLNTLASSRSNFSQINNNTIHSGNKSDKLNILEHEEIDIEKIGKSEVWDSYCNGFFIAGLHPKDPKLIQESENILGPCGHKKCAILNAYRPDVLQSFPNNNIEGIELNETVYYKLLKNI